MKKFMNRIIPMGSTWIYVKDLVMTLTVLAITITFVVMQGKIQAAEFRAHVAEELLEKSQDAIVNQEVAN